MSASFSQGWWAIDLAPHRRGGGTYVLLETSEIPPLDEGMFRGDFRWLPRTRRSEYKEVDLHEQLARLQAQTMALGFSLPEPFVRFMGDRAFRQAIFSCTACGWELPEKPVPVSPGSSIHAIRFLSDQQGCLFWYLLLGPGVHGQILCSPVDLDDPDHGGYGDEPEESPILCAPHIEHFVYRFWMENELWSALHEKSALTPEQEAYLAFYRSPPPEPDQTEKSHEVA